VLFGKQAYKNSLQALEQALLATGTAWAARTSTHVFIGASVSEPLSSDLPFLVISPF